MQEESADSLREDMRYILDRALDASMPGPGVRRALADRSIADRIASCRRLAIFALGKAAIPMAEAALDDLRTKGRRIDETLIVSPSPGSHSAPRGARVIFAGHPLPDESSLLAGTAAFELADRLGPEDLLLFLVSGGGSALMDVPVPGISLADLREANRRWIGSGLSIHRINRERCRLSQIKGGGLLRRVAPARVVQLLLSDVPGDDPSLVASGPCLFLSPVQNPRDQILLDLVFSRSVGNAAMALDAAVLAAGQRGYAPLALTSVLEGEAESAGGFFAAIAREIRRSGRPVSPPCAVIATGETVVRLPSALNDRRDEKMQGEGGRNQHTALAAAIALADLPGVLFASQATDGRDGPTDAAGGLVDGSTARRIEAAGLDATGLLDARDSYRALSSVDALLRTGPTGTNVNDLMVLLVREFL